MGKSIRTEAQQLANRAYFLVMFRDKTTDGDYLYLATNPEIEGCMAQGETMEQAEENLNEVRVDIIEHLLEHDLPVPEPPILAATEGNSIELPDLKPTEPDMEDVFGAASEPEYRERQFGALLRT